MNQKILVTGGSGLLGSYLIRWFKQKGYANITATYQSSSNAIPQDIREGVNWQKLKLPDKAASFEIIEGHDWVIHSAGLVSYHKKDKFRLLEINQTGTEHIVNACQVHNISHLVYVGSIGALGKESDHVTLNESSTWLQTMYSTAYGLSKYLGELEAWRGAGEGLNVSVILPSVILGTGDWQKSSLQLVDRIANKSPLYPSGQTGYVDVRDIVDFIGILLEKSLSGDRWILNGANMTYKELYQKIAFHLNLNRKFRLAPKWLAQSILMSGNLIRRKSIGMDMINQVYGTFTYDSSKSLTVDGFRYRDMEDTIREVADIFRNGGNEKTLPFGH